MAQKSQFVLLLFIAAPALAQHQQPTKRQSTAASSIDAETAETGFPGAGVHAGSKYFQYIHVPAKDHYEHGHRRGNEHHFIERHEKGHPHEGEFKTKVRWGDKHGGYGEHFWDYNHAGHGGHDGEETQEAALYAEPEEPANHRPIYAENPREKREFGDLEDVEFISDSAKKAATIGDQPRHGGNYREERDYGRGKREQKKRRIKGIDGRNLIYRPDTGIVVDGKSGQRYELRPLDY